VSYRLAVKSLYENLNIHSALAFAGIAGPLVLIATDVTAAFSNPGYNMVRHSISSLALTSIGWLQTIGFLAIGLLVEIFTAGLLFNIRRARGFHIGIGGLVFMGFGMLIIGAFRTDPIGTPDTVEGTIHSLAAMVVFWLFPIVSLLIAPSLKKDPYWRNIFKYTLVTGVLALALVLLVGFLEDTASWFGLAERILVLNMIVWVEVTAIKLLLLSVRQSRKAKSV
jgi:hypothetical protein